MSALNSPVVSPIGNSPWEKEYFRASLYVWGLQYCELCDALVDLVFLDEVKCMYLSLSIEIIP